MLFDDLLKHAESAYPNECCGVIIKDNTELRYIPMENRSNTPTESFEFNSVAYVNILMKYNIDSILLGDCCRGIFQ